jgi:Uma2 family endonuclease
VRGRASLENGYLEEIPDLVVEVSFSSKTYDLGQKLTTYRASGVREHITVLIKERRVEWRVLSGTKYRKLHATHEGILSSPNFAGLWLDTEALFPLDRPRLFAAVDRGAKATLADSPQPKSNPSSRIRR